MATTQAIDTAYGHAAQGSPLLGRAVLESAGRRGEVNALAELANWLLRGDIIARDVAAAREYLRRASTLGDAGSMMLEAALAANGSGGRVDWSGAVALLRQAATISEVAAAQLALIDRMTLDVDGAPLAVAELEQVSERPAVWRAAHLLSPDECRQIALTASDLLEPATVTDPLTGRNIVNPIRTSHTAIIGPTRENLVIRALNRRIAAMTGTEVAQGEALTVLRYTAGQRFRPHLDALPQTANQRTKTVLVYLNHGFTGGATTFPYRGLRIVPNAGDALVFDNVDKDGGVDRSALHEGEPVIRGVKWLATRWIRARAFDVWQGPEAAV
jgi:prolyl 4-hydroxylase